MAAFQKGIKILRSVPKSKPFRMCSIPKHSVVNHNESNWGMKGNCTRRCNPNSSTLGHTNNNGSHSSYVVRKQFSSDTFRANSGCSQNNRYKSIRGDSVSNETPFHKEYNADIQAHRNVPQRPPQLTLDELKLWEGTVQEVFNLVKNIITGIERLLTCTLNESSKIGSKLNHSMEYFRPNKKQNNSNKEIIITTSKVDQNIHHKEIFKVKSRETSSNKNDHGKHENDHRSISLSYLYTTKPRQKNRMAINMVHKRSHSPVRKDNARNEQSKEVNDDLTGSELNIMNTQDYTKLTNCLKKLKIKFNKNERKNKLENTTKNITTERSICNMNKRCLKENVYIINSEKVKTMIDNKSTNNNKVLKNKSESLDSHKTSDSKFTNSSYYSTAPNYRTKRNKKTKNEQNIQTVQSSSSVVSVRYEKKYYPENYQKNNNVVTKGNSKVISENYIKKLEHCMQLLEVLYRNYKITTINEHFNGDSRKEENKMPLRHIFKGTLLEPNPNKISTRKTTKSVIGLRNIQDKRKSHTLIINKNDTNGQDSNKSSYPQKRSQINMKHIDQEMILKELSTNKKIDFDKLLQNNDIVKGENSLCKNIVKNFKESKTGNSKSCFKTNHSNDLPVKARFDKCKGDMNSGDDNNKAIHIRNILNKKIDSEILDRNNAIDIKNKMKCPEQTQCKLKNKSSSEDVINRLIKFGPLSVIQDVLQRKRLKDSSCNADSIVKNTSAVKNVISSFASIYSKLTSNETIISPSESLKTSVSLIFQPNKMKKRAHVSYSKGPCKRNEQVTDLKVVKLMKHPNIEPHVLESLKKCSTERLKQLFNIIKNDESHRHHSTFFNTKNKTPKSTRLNSKPQRNIEEKESQIITYSKATIKPTTRLHKPKSKVHLIQEDVEMNDDRIYVKGKHILNKLKNPVFIRSKNDSQYKELLLKHNLNPNQIKEQDDLVNPKMHLPGKHELDRLKQTINITYDNKYEDKNNRFEKTNEILQNNVSECNNKDKSMNRESNESSDVEADTKIYIKTKVNPTLDLSLFSNSYNEDMYNKCINNSKQIKTEPQTIIQFKNDKFIYEDQPEVPVEDDISEKELHEVFENESLFKKKHILNKYVHHSSVSEDVRNRRKELKARLLQRVINRSANTFSVNNTQNQTDVSNGESGNDEGASSINITSNEIYEERTNKNRVLSSLDNTATQPETAKTCRVKQIKQCTLSRSINDKLQDHMVRLALLKKSLCRQESVPVEDKLNETSSIITQYTTAQENNDYLFYTRLNNLKHYSSTSKIDDPMISSLNVSKMLAAKKQQSLEKTLSSTLTNQSQDEPHNITLMDKTKHALVVVKNEIKCHSRTKMGQYIKQNDDKSNKEIDVMNYNDATKIDISRNDLIPFKKRYTLNHIENLLNRSKIVHGTLIADNTHKMDTENNQRFQWNNRSPLVLKKQKSSNRTENEVYNMLHNYRVWKHANSIIKSKNPGSANSAVQLQNSELNRHYSYVIHHSDTVTGSDFSRRPFITLKKTRNAIPEPVLFKTMYKNIKKDNLSYTSKED